MTPAAALSIAKQFHRAFELCRGNGLVAADGRSNVDIPGIVNLAFAIELGLKASHFSHKTLIRRGHKLDQLYAALPQTDREFIAHHSSLGEEKIALGLPEVANAFEEWRYIYEESGTITISVQFLMLFWLGVEKLAETKRQEQLAELKRVGNV